MANEITEAMELIKQAQAKFKEAGLVSDIDVWFHSGEYQDNHLSQSESHAISSKFESAMASELMTKKVDEKNKVVSLRTTNNELEIYIAYEGVTEDDESNFLFQD